MPDNPDTSARFPPKAVPMRINCPHCHSPIELVDAAVPDEILCPSCGSSFHVARGSTTGWNAADSRQQVGRFELIHTVGSGAIGTVHKGQAWRGAPMAIAIRSAMVVFLVAGGLFLLASSARFAGETEVAGWASLWNGKDLDGWVQRGGKARYSVKDGEIVGTSVPNTIDSFLCTKRNYSDFILELEFHVQAPLNSGVQVRSHCFDEARTVELGGKKILIPAGRVHGYQVEIDPSTRAWTGGIYDEGRRGWLKDLKENVKAQKAFKDKQWNKFHIECRGDSIKTWLNGVVAAELKDSATAAGFIALQVHEVGNRTDPLEVRFRNLRIKELK
jgi:hypothetical protein